MRRSSVLTLVLITLFVLSLASPYDLDTTTDTSLTDPVMSDLGFLSEGETAYTGVGVALDVSFSGTFTNNSPWSASSNTLSELLTPGASFLVENNTLVTWTAYVLVSPPPGVKDLNFSVDYSLPDWRPISVIDPLGVIMTNPTDWHYEAGILTVESSAISTHGLWKLEFIATNHLENLLLGPSGQSLSSTGTFDTSSTIDFQVTSSWITGATAELTLIDPTGLEWASVSNSTSDPISHLISSFAHRKNFTINSAYVNGDKTDFPVLIDILDTDLHDDVQSSGNDILFMSGSTVLSHEIELFQQNYDSTRAQLVAWVKADLSGSSNTIITMYYGNPDVGPQENPSDVWTNDYSVVWHLGEDVVNEGTGGIHSDSTSGDYYGIQDGNVEVTGIFGNAQQFYQDDQIIVNAARGLEPSGDVTISGWFKLDNAHDSTTETQSILTKAIGPNTDMHIALKGVGYSGGAAAPFGSMVFKVENDDQRVYTYSTQTSWNADEWYYFAVTMYAGNPLANNIYINGIDDTAGNSDVGTWADLSFIEDWVIGGGFSDQLATNYGYFNGTIDEVRISNTIRTTPWLSTEYAAGPDYPFFMTPGTEANRQSPELSFSISLDTSAPAGVWTAAVHYNDSGSSVSHRVGEYQRNFIVKRGSDLAIDSPFDAAAGLETLTVGELLYLVVDLSDTNTGTPIVNASVSMNWTTPSTIDFEDLGDGRYSVARNTSELSENKRWYLNISSAHSFYLDSTDNFTLDLYHPTQLSYEWVTTTPVGFDVNATLVYRDTWDGSLISGATITLGDGTPVTPILGSPGRYIVTINADALAPGAYSQIFNATKSTGFYEMASSNVTYLMRPHFTAISVTGGLVTPYGEPTPVIVEIIDLDTGLPLVTTSSVNSWNFTSGYAPVNEVSPADFAVSLTTGTWDVGPETVTLSVSMGGIYYSPADYDFDITIRNHLTAANVIGDLTTAFGANTTITVSLIDLDGGTINIENVTSFTFTSSRPDLVYNPPGSFTLILDTDDWPVSTIVVTLQVVLSGNYDNPTNYVFSITIRKLTTTLYNAPTNFLFPRESDFEVIVHFNVSEIGTYYGFPIDGEVLQFSSPEYDANFTALGYGTYRVTISWSIFEALGTSDFTITINVNPSSSLYQSASLVVSFKYREIETDLTANLYTVSIPYNKDVTIHLYYVDRDSGIGITTAIISSYPDPSIVLSAPHVSNGDYLVTLNSSKLALGPHTINLTASAGSYKDKWVIITIVVTQTSTNLEPETIRLEIPSGNTVVFILDWIDLVNNVPIDNVGTSYSDNWNGTLLSIFWTGTEYEVTFETTTSDSLGTYLLWFNFTKTNYQPGYCEIQVEIRSHDTILTVESPPPTAINALINISLYYYDFDNKVGIDDYANLQQYVYEGASSITSDLLDDGNGYYVVQIDASTLGSTGVYNFTVFINWTGVIQQYENKFVYVSVTVEGAVSQLTLTLAADPSAYSETMIYRFIYNERDSGIGISNTTNPYGDGHVHIFVSFDVSFDSSKITISEVDAVTNPGLYQIEINTTGFGQIGQFLMSITIDWDDVDPYYSTRFDSVSVVVLARDTLLLINPPSPESYGEIATFSFSWEDTGTSSNILNSSELLHVSMDIDFNVVDNAGVFTITFNTNQFAGVATYVMTLNVTWAGEPFYSNRTNRLISITVLNRQTVLDYPTPDPTFYGDNVTIAITWTDVTNGGIPNGILGATVVVTDNNGLIPLNEYYINPLAGGVYEIEFDTSRFATTGDWNITIYMSSSITGIQDKNRSRNLDLRERRTILSYEAIGKVAYDDPIEFILYFEDLYTATSIGNGTGDVTLEILTIGTWVFTSTWNAIDEWYDIVITSYPPQTIGSPFNITFNMSYSNIAPFYASDTVTGSFELRERLSLLSLEYAPNPTPYKDNATFTVLFSDVDSGVPISVDYIEVYFSGTKLTKGSEYTYSFHGGGFYEILVNSTFLSGTIGQKGITVNAVAQNYRNATLGVYIRVTTRDTILDLVVPPLQTRYLNNMTLTFRYLDLSRNEAITSIGLDQITILNNGIELLDGEFTLTQEGDAFRISINSTILGSTLDTYNVTVLVAWIGGAPYYLAASVESFVTTTNRLISFSASPIDETPFGNLLNISFRLTDSGRGWLIDLSNVTLTFDAQNPSIILSEGGNYWIYPDVPSTGIFTIRIDTSDLITPGSHFFDLYVNWNPASEPYYANMAKIVLEGVIGNLETELTAWPDAIVEVGWKLSADVYVDYYTFIYGNLTTGATISWAWAGGEGIASESSPGRYYFELDTSLVDAKTWTVTIEAVRNNYALARCYVTLVITPLPAQIQVLDPVGEDLTIPRGSAVPITVYLEDSTFVIPINHTYVILAEFDFQSQTYPLTWNLTDGYFTGLIDAGSATDLPEGSYSILVRAQFRNYAPVSLVININTIQARTALGLIDDTGEEMSVEYTGYVIFTVNLTTPDFTNSFNNTLFSQADVRWIIDEGGWNGTFDSIGLGLYQAIVDTTDLGYGIWPVSIKARMWDNVTLFSDSSIQLTLTITRIETTVDRPANLNVAWGWTGDVAITYNGTYGPIAGATADFTGTLIVGDPIDLGNGTYLIYIDSKLAVPGTFSINIVFSKPNYQEAPSTVQITVREVGTTIYPESVLYTPGYIGTIEDLRPLQIPIGDSMFIDFFYNDTDDGNEYFGGLSGAYHTINSYLRGPSIEGYLNVTIISLGNGLYRFVFDTLDENISAFVDTQEYSLFIQMKLDNHTAAEITFKIEVINITTSLEISGQPVDWTFTNGNPIILELTYFDTWHGVGIDGATLFANVSSGAPFSTQVSDGPNPGTYRIEIVSGGILLSNGFGTITITIDKQSFSANTESHLISVLQNGRDSTLTVAITYGIPLLLIVALFSAAYVRVWNVPKRLRQINGMIKSLRKGKVPKPVTEAASRQDLIAELFNDTYAKLDITRTPDQMPEESVPVDVPELGELLIQLAILTNLDQQELDEFKADIVKMKISEQAAFVKEVIVQEAIRAARRDHKTVEEVIAEVEAQAASRLAGEGEGVATEDGVAPEEVEPDIETVILPDKEDVPEADETPTFDDTETSDDEVPDDRSDKLSPFEIEELKKDLESRGVPAHEIDVILQQAKKLPRELVEELVKSLGRDR